MYIWNKWRQGRADNIVLLFRPVFKNSGSTNGRQTWHIYRERCNWSHSCGCYDSRYTCREMSGVLCSGARFPAQIHRSRAALQRALVQIDNRRGRANDRAEERSYLHHSRVRWYDRHTCFIFFACFIGFFIFVTCRPYFSDHCCSAVEHYASERHVGALTDCV